MSIFLSKFIPLFIYPLGIACILIITAMVIHRWKKLQRLALILAVTLLWICGNKWVAMALMRSVEWQYLPPQETPHAEVIVLLGGATSSALYPRVEVELNGAADRVFYSARLYHDGAAPFILASGGRIDWLEQGNSAAQDMAEILEMLNVPPSAIWLEENSRNTQENASECWKFLQAKGIRRVILVTSAFHMPRSVRLFKAQGFEVIPAPTDFSITQKDWDAQFSFNPISHLIDLFPNSSNLADTTRVLREYLGTLSIMW